MELGQIVFSLAGRDKTMPFIVLKADKEYVYLTDGKQRKINALKKKKIKHVQKTNTVLQEIAEKANAGKLIDADVRKALKISLSIKE